MTIKIQLLVESLLKNRKISNINTDTTELDSAKDVINNTLPKFLTGKITVLSITNSCMMLECTDMNSKYYVNQSKLQLIKDLNNNHLNITNIKISMNLETKTKYKPLAAAVAPSAESRKTMLETASYIEDKDLAQALKNLAMIKIKK